METLGARKGRFFKGMKSWNAKPLAPDGSKHCGKCDTYKPLSEFRKNRTKRLGVYSICKVCENAAAALRPNKAVVARRAYNKYKYGITEEQYMAMHRKQGGHCLCMQKLIPYGRDTCVDHCHYTGKFRGLLCQACNKAIAFAGDNPLTLERLARYVLAHEREGGPVLERLKYESTEPPRFGRRPPPRLSRDEQPQP